MLRKTYSHCTPQGHSRTYHPYVCRVPAMLPCWLRFGDSEVRQGCIVFARRLWNEQDSDAKFDMKGMLFTH